VDESASIRDAVDGERGTCPLTNAERAARACDIVMLVPRSRNGMIVLSEKRRSCVRWTRPFVPAPQAQPGSPELATKLDARIPCAGLDPATQISGFGKWKLARCARTERRPAFFVSERKKALFFSCCLQEQQAGLHPRGETRTRDCYTATTRGFCAGCIALGPSPRESIVMELYFQSGKAGVHPGLRQH
jgi:hypothetical protein